MLRLCGHHLQSNLPLTLLCIFLNKHLPTLSLSSSTRLPLTLHLSFCASQNSFNLTHSLSSRFIFLFFIFIFYYCCCYYLLQDLLQLNQKPRDAQHRIFLTRCRPSTTTHYAVRVQKINQLSCLLYSLLVIYVFQFFKMMIFVVLIVACPLRISTLSSTIIAVHFSKEIQFSNLHLCCTAVF